MTSKVSFSFMKVRTQGMDNRIVYSSLVRFRYTKTTSASYRPGYRAKQFRCGIVFITYKLLGG